MGRSLDEIMSDRDQEDGADAPGPETEQTSEGGSGGQLRDQRGRFASSKPPSAMEDQGGAPPAGDGSPSVPDGYVPIQAMDARLAKSEERFNSLLQQNQQLMAAIQGLTRPPDQPPPAAPDFFDDPDAAFKHRISSAMQPLQQQQQAIIERFSSMMAVEKHGLETVQNAYAALASRVQQLGPSDPVYQRIMSSQHPYGTLVQWHQEQSALQRYGADPEAYIRAEVEKRIAEMQGQPPTGGPAPRERGPAMPQSLTNGQNAGSRTTTAYRGPRPLSEIMGR